MQLTNQTKIASAIVVAGALTVGIVAAQSFRSPVESALAQHHQKQQAVVEQPANQREHFNQRKASDTLRLALNANPIDPKVAKAYQDQAVRSLTIEKQARQFLKERRFEEAEKSCYRALALSPKFNGQSMASSTFQLLGDIYHEQGRYHDALDSYFKARQHTRDLQLDLGIALSYLKLGDPENARKFYSEKQVFAERLSDQPPAKRAAYMVQLPGTKTTKTMEASIYFARGCEKSSYVAMNEAVEDYKKALFLVPRNALIASRCGDALRFLRRRPEAATYWARAVVFGRGDVARQARIDLNNNLMPAQVEQTLHEARKIR